MINNIFMLCASSNELSKANAIMKLYAHDFLRPPDQTPTPTRFLRNCEESGLFQELETNPFDQASPLCALHI